MVDEDQAESLLRWLRGGTVSRLTEGLTDSNPRLSTLVEVPGDPDFASHARSFALQIEFRTIEDAHAWGDARLMPLIADYTAKFGIERAAIFTTILEEIEL